MLPTLTLILCVALVALLLYIERKGNPSTTLALWIPTFYMLILGSRPLGQWFGRTIVLFESSDFETGSPLDRYVLIILLLLTVWVLFRRKIGWASIFRDNFALILLYLYLGISILWSEQAFVSFKRWFRLIEVIPLAMVVLSEGAPLAALESIFRRCAYVLIPFSIILAKYYPHLGVGYGQWSGLLFWNGVALTKNALAHLCLVSSFFIIWAFFRDRRIINISRTTSTTLADGLILAIAVYLLFGGPGGFSATSTANFIVIIFALILLYKMKNRAEQCAAILFFAVALMWIILIFSESFVSTITSFLGRDQTFTGRTDIWAMAMRDAAQNPIMGTGFGSYFATANEFTKTFGNTGHNGLLDVYVELGIVGVLILLVFLFSFFRRMRGELNQSFDWGIFGICLLIVSLLANYTESLFLKSSSYIWASMNFLAIAITTQCKDMEEDRMPTDNFSSSS